MAAPFVQKSLKPATLLQRLLRRSPRQNAVTLVENALARAPRVSEVTAQEVRAKGEEFKVIVTSRFPKEMEALYRKFLEFSLRDRHLSSAEADDLRHLQDILGLSASSAEKIHEEAAADLYGAAVKEAIADGRLTEDERRFLAGVVENLKLPEDVATARFRDAAETYYNAALNSAVGDERLSPSEDQELQALARTLNLQVAADDHTAAWLNRLRMYWLIENGEVPTIDVEEHLQKAEVCYATQAVEWYENRTVTRSIKYGGVTGRVRIAKGIYFRVGEVAVQKVQDEVLKHIDTGRILITNKRILFRGQKKNSVIPLKKVIDFTPFRNGLQVEKDTGRPIFLEFEDGVDIIALVLDRAVRDINS